LVEPLLIVRQALHEQISVLHRRLCRRLMTIPGVGPVVALTYRATIDVPARFKNSKAVGAVFGLTPSKYQSGEINRTGAISKCGDEMMRVMLYEAAQVMLTRTNKWSWLKAWAMKIARQRGMKKAIVALARRLAVIMHRIWVDGTEFRWVRKVVAARGPYGINYDRRISSSTERWNDVPRGTMDEVSSLGRLDLPFV
jgi:transposase